MVLVFVELRHFVRHLTIVVEIFFPHLQLSKVENNKQQLSPKQQVLPAHSLVLSLVDLVSALIHKSLLAFGSKHIH